MAWSSPPRLWLRLLKQAPNPLALQQRSRGAQTQSNSSPMSYPRTSEIRLPIRPALVYKCLQTSGHLWIVLGKKLQQSNTDCHGSQAILSRFMLFAFFL